MRLMRAIVLIFDLAGRVKMRRHLRLPSAEIFWQVS